MHPESTPTWLIGPEVAPSQRIGTVLSGSYRLDAFLGQGMTGVTYNAWHLRQKQPYALKLLHRELAPSHDRVVKLRHDLRALSGLRKFGFLPVELNFAPDGAPFLASELLIGETLRSRLGHGPLPSLASGIVAAALARALGEAHKAGMVHGDLRPENVLLPTEAGRDVDAGQPVLLDAALHHLRKRPIGLDESLPLSKLVYLAPEQASGEQQTADAAGDIFALGAILYESLTGQQAFAGSELEVILEKLAQPPKKLVLPREVGAPPGLAEALDEVIAKACARDPEERYQSMADLLEGLGAAYKKAGLPLPPPDERIPIDTVQAQNRALRKRTVAVKRVVPTAPLPDADVPEPSKVLTAASMPLPTPEEIEPDGDKTIPQQFMPPSTGAKPEQTVPMKRNTAKQRVLRPTRRARDLSKLVAEIEAGRLTPEQAMAMAQSNDDNVESDEAFEATDEAPKPASEEEQMKAEGRAAVLARAEEAKKNREQQLRDRQAREKAEAQEMQRRLLDQARAETLGRMRAEWEQSRAAKVSASESAKASRSGEAVPVSTTKDQATQQAELLAEAGRQAQRLEEERIEAERRAREESERARKEAEAAEASRREQARIEAEIQEAERKEAERAERMRLKAEREAQARERAEAADQERQAKIAAVEAAERAAEEAKREAETKQRQADEAKQAVETEEAMSAWEEGLDLLVEDEGKKPPPPPVEALRDKSTAAQLAEEAARRAREDAEAAEEVAQRAKEEAAAMARSAEEARKAKEAAEASRIREASEFAAIIAAAEEARAKEQVIQERIREAERRAKDAEQASVKEQARATRATQALVVIRQVENLARRDPISEEPTVPVMLDETTQRRPGGNKPAGSTAPPSSTTPLVLSQTTQQVVPEPSYAAFQMNQALRMADGSAGYTASQMAAAGIPSSEANPFNTGQVAAQAMAAGIRQGMTASQSLPSISGTPLMPLTGNSGPVPMQQMASGPVSAGIPTGNMPILQGSGPVSMVQPVVMMPARPADAGGFNFTARQLVVTLGMTSVLSGVIGSLLTLLILRSQQPVVPPPVTSPADSDPLFRNGTIKPNVPTPSGPFPGTQAKDPGGAGTGGDTVPAPIPTPPTPPGPSPAAKTGLRPPGTILPPLRLASEQPTMPPKPSQWLLKAAARPGQPAQVTPVAQPGAKPGVKATSEDEPEAKPAAETKPAPEAKPAAETKPEAKPAAESKPVAKPAESKPAAKPGAGAKPGVKDAAEEGLRNPFSNK